MQNKQALSIGLVGPVPPPHGGMANQVRQLHRLLDGEGVKIELIPVNPPYAPKWIERVKGVRALFRLVPYLFRVFRSSSRVELFHLFANSGWSWHLFAAPVVWIGRMTGTPVIVNYRGGEAGAFMASQSRWVAPSLRRATRLVVPSGFLQAEFSKWGLESHIVPNIINLELFGLSEKRTKGALQQPHLLVSRNLEPIYDVATVLRAFKAVLHKVPAAKLTVAGEGPERAKLEQLAKELGIDPAVEFAGRLKNEEIASLLRSVDLVVNASRVDNMPISLLEAMASGTPVVSTNAGGIPYIVRDGETALLIEIGDDVAMAEAILELLGDPASYQRMSEAGRTEVAKYEWENVRPLWFNCYEQVRNSNR